MNVFAKDCEIDEKNSSTVKYNIVAWYFSTVSKKNDMQRMRIIFQGVRVHVGNKGRERRFFLEERRMEGVWGVLLRWKLVFLINRIFFRIAKKSNQPMLQTPFHLFSAITSSQIQALQELERPKLRNIFTVNKTEIALTLTDNYIAVHQSPNKGPTHICPLTFELKFEVIYQTLPVNPSMAQNQTCLGLPIAIKLEREGCPEQFTFHAIHPTVAEKWSLELEKKINQRNFHKLFKAKRKIGKGAFATVYLAERLRDHKMVAVKAFSKEKQFSGDKGKESLQNEIKIMRRLNHLNIMRLEGVYETENSIYVILEYLQGQQLNDLLKNKTSIQENEVKTIIQSILKALSHLSKHRIIHRDLKPENIIFKRQDSFEVSICDFGLATDADEEKYLFVRCGTPGFVAPEIINIRDLSTKSQSISDMFSAGIIFHYLLFGSSVFEGKKYNEILSQNRLCSYNFEKQIYKQMNPRAFDLLTQMLEKDPTKRISAESALNHQYFSGDMDIEVQEKSLTLTSSLSFKNRDTLTISSENHEEKPYFFNGSTKDESRYLYI